MQHKNLAFFKAMNKEKCTKEWKKKGQHMNKEVELICEEMQIINIILSLYQDILKR